jgi:hypothetical protein
VLHRHAHGMLAVHNLVCRAMNVAADVGWPKVDAQAVAGC